MVFWAAKELVIYLSVTHPGHRLQMTAWNFIQQGIGSEVEHNKVSDKSKSLDNPAIAD